jgi:hypothetical protein
MRSFSALFLFAVAFVFSGAAVAEDEINPFDADGRPTAYIVVADEERTIYLWEGKAVAYLDYNEAGDLDVFGFNGKHLGWFIDGLLRDHDGNVACAVKQRVGRPVTEPPKPFKRQKPFLNFRNFPPLLPTFTDAWSATSCWALLKTGAN